jgi:hypothetical protein
MIKIDVRGIDAVQRKLKQLSSDLQAKAGQMAINKTAQKAKTEIKRAVTTEFAIKANEVASSVYLNPSKMGKTGKVEATIDIFGSPSRKGRSMNVVHFLEKSITMGEAKRRSKQNKLYGIGRGGKLLPILGFKFKKAGGTKQIEGAFIGNKGRTVFVRTGKSRLPIKPVQMIGVSQMFSAERIKSRVMDKINRDLIEETSRAVDYLISKAAK